MSATGKSTVIAELAARGYNAVDLDQPAWSEMRTAASGDGIKEDWVWQEDRVRELLSTEDPRVLFVSGCASNQVLFYGQFDDIVLLTAPPEVLIERLRTRTTNSYGKRPEELALVLHYQQTVEPLLRRSATLEVDTRAPLDEVLSAIFPLADPRSA